MSTRNVNQSLFRQPADQHSAQSAKKLYITVTIPSWSFKYFL